MSDPVGLRFQLHITHTLKRQKIPNMYFFWIDRKDEVPAEQVVL